MVACLAAVFLTPTVFAQTVPASVVNSTLTAQVVSLVDGKAVSKPATDAKPGDVIEYRAVYANNTRSGINGLLATIAVPAGTTFIAGSAAPAGPTASVDAVTFAPMPLIRTVKAAGGVLQKEPVPLADYRAVRWNAGALAAGQETVVSVRVQVNSTVTAPSNSTFKPTTKP